MRVGGRRGVVLHVVPNGLCGDGGTVFCPLPVLLRQRRLHDDGGPLPQVLARGRLGGHDGLGAVHPGRRLAAEVAVRLLPAPQLGEVLLLDVLLRHGQLGDLQRQAARLLPPSLSQGKGRERRETADEVPSQLGTIKRKNAGHVSLYLLHQEGLLHVLWPHGSQQLHGFVEALAGLELLLGSQHAFQQNQAHPEEDLDPCGEEEAAAPSDTQTTS